MKSLLSILAMAICFTAATAIVIPDSAQASSLSKKIKKATKKVKKTVKKGTHDVKKTANKGAAGAKKGATKGATGLGNGVIKGSEKTAAAGQKGLEKGAKMTHTTKAMNGQAGKINKTLGGAENSVLKTK